jgi:hypothetical protein
MTTATRDVRLREVTSLALVEASAGDGPFNPDGTVNVVIVRPCNGRGPGQHIFEAAVLEREAPKWAGVPQYLNHDVEASRRARGGMPRSPLELGGVIRESWWDPDYTSRKDAALGFGRGAVVARAAVTEQVEALIRRVPEAMKLSMNAQATRVRRGTRNGKSGWIVEGFDIDPERSSVDWVTNAGAGGEVQRAVLEAISTATRTGVAPQPSSRRLAMAGMTLQEALQTPEVRAFIGAEARSAVAPGRVAEAARSDGPTPTFGGDDSEWVKFARRRGLEPTDFGAPWPADEDEDDIAASLAVHEASAALTDEQRALVEHEPAWAARLRDLGFSSDEIGRRGWAA